MSKETTTFQIMYLGALSSTWEHEGLPFNDYKEALQVKQERFPDAPLVREVGLVIPVGNIAQRHAVRGVWVCECGEYGVKYCRISLRTQDHEILKEDRGILSVLGTWFKEQSEAVAIAQLLFPKATMMQ